MNTAEKIARIERKLKRRTLRPGERVQLGYMLLVLRRAQEKENAQ